MRVKTFQCRSPALCTDSLKLFVANHCWFAKRVHIHTWRVTKATIFNMCFQSSPSMLRSCCEQLPHFLMSTVKRCKHRSNPRDDLGRVRYNSWDVFISRRIRHVPSQALAYPSSSETAHFLLVVDIDRVRQLGAETAMPRMLRRGRGLRQAPDGVPGVKPHVDARPKVVRACFPSAAAAVIHVDNLRAHTLAFQLLHHGLNFGWPRCVSDFRCQYYSCSAHGIEQKIAIASLRSILRPVENKYVVTNLLIEFVDHLILPIVRIANEKITEPIIS